MIRFRSVLALLWAGCSCSAFAQTSEVSIAAPKPPPVIGRLITPFHPEKRVISPPRLSNTPRLESLVRAGNLYLSVQDLIALVLENNLDIAVQRYSPYLAREVMRRTAGGGFLRQVDTPILPGPTSVSTTGISVNANGLAGGAGLGSGGGIVSQIGPVPPNLDPSVYVSLQAGHLTTPETNTYLNNTSVLTNNYRQLVLNYSQQFVTGTSASMTYYQYRSLLNSSVPLYNPSLNGFLDLQIAQNLLQGFNIAVNNRDIRVAKNNLKVSDLQLKLQVSTTVSAALNLYWDLVSFIDAVRIKQTALQTSQKLYDDDQKMVKIGALPSVELTRAAAQVSVSKQDLLFAQTNVQQQEIVLKNALSRNAMANTWLDDVHIIPLNHFEIPKTDEIRPLPDLVAEAMQNRVEIARSRVNIESQKILIRGDRNGLLPSLQAFLELTNNGLSGPINPTYSGAAPDPYFLGGTGNLLGQIFRRNFPNYSAGVALTIPIRNRAAQADFVTDELTLRQSELQLRRAENQVTVDVRTAVIGLQQARARYETAVNTRELGEQALKDEENRFQHGVSTVALVVQAQRDLATDDDAEVQAMANYTHAKIAFDAALGRTLEVNHISMAEAASGHVSRESAIAEPIPDQKGSRP
ncbi:MAG TPA: TolC family protein [Bryobacteraceae bacterium]|nr:TolC family protein [Bryobacteraceae bacterium]